MEIIRRNTDYGIRALVYLAANPENVTTARDIADTMEIPIGFLQKIMQKFVHKGLVISHRGTHGGFSLGKNPDQITVLDIVETLQGKPTMNKCFLGKEACPRAAKCKLKNTWLQMEQKILSFMEETTLQDLVEQLNADDS